MINFWFILKVLIVIVGSWALLYVIYYAGLPIIILGSFFRKHYAAFRIEDQTNKIYGVKFRKSDPWQFYQVKNPPKDVKSRNYGYYMLDQHRRAYDQLAKLQEDARKAAVVPDVVKKEIINGIAEKGKNGGK